MLTQDWLTDIVLYLYALSLLFFVSDAARGNRSAKRVGTGLLVFVWVLQTGVLLDLLFAQLREPSVTLKDYLFFVSWLLVSASWVVHRLYRAELLVLLVNAAGFSVLALNLLQHPHRDMALAPWEAARRLLVAHVSLISIGFVLLTIGAMLSGMYTLLHRQLKRKKWGELLRRMPSLEWTGRQAYRMGLLGVPMLLLAVSTGLAALLAEGEPGALLDGKVAVSLAACGVYAGYLIRGAARRDDGIRLARWNLVGYALLVVNYFANDWSSFHRWV